MLQTPNKTLGLRKIGLLNSPVEWGGGSKPYLASGLLGVSCLQRVTPLKNEH